MAHLHFFQVVGELCERHGVNGAQTRPIAGFLPKREMGQHDEGCAGQTARAATAFRNHSFPLRATYRGTPRKVRGRFSWRQMHGLLQCGNGGKCLFQRWVLESVEKRKRGEWGGSEAAGVALAVPSRLSRLSSLAFEMRTRPSDERPKLLMEPRR
jgi:hypothetical protein